MSGRDKYNQPAYVTNYGTQNPPLHPSSEAGPFTSGNTSLGPAAERPWTGSEPAAIAVPSGVGVNLTPGATMPTPTEATVAPIFNTGGTQFSGTTAAALATPSVLPGRAGISLAQSAANSILTGSYTNTLVLSTPGTTTVTATGQIVAASGDGADLSGGAALFNYGVVAAAGTNFFAGAHLNNGSVTNFGSISGGIGAEISSKGALTNYGTIIGLSTAGFTAGVIMGGTPAILTNGASGSAAGVISGNVGVYTDFGSATIVNFGTINGRVAGIDVYPGDISGGAVSIQNVGTVVGGVGVTSHRNPLTLNDFGTVSGTTGPGVVLGSGAVTVVNYGTIAGVGTAVALGTGPDLLVIEPGAVFNGAIGGFTAIDMIDIAHAVVTGVTVANGTLTAVSAGGVVAAFALTGAYTSHDFAISSDGKDGSNLTITQPTGNTLSGTYYHTIVLSNPPVQNPFTVTSTGLVVAAVGDGVLGTAGFAWTVSNSGTISPTATSFLANGINLTAGGLVRNELTGFISSGGGDGVLLRGAGTVVNFGTIAGGYKGSAVDAGGTIINYGTIYGTAAHSLGAYSRTGGQIFNFGTVVSGTGAFVNGSGLTNYGTIRGTSTGHFVAGAIVTNGGRLANGTNAAPTGVITGDVGVYSDGSATIVNFGTIGGGQIAVSVYRGDISNAIGTVINYGQIVAGSTGGIGVQFFRGTVTNFGTITAGTNGTGIKLVSGQVTNSGSIIAAGSAGRAVYVRFGTFLNLGLVEGSVSGIELALSTDATGIGKVTVSGAVTGATGISVAAGSTVPQTVTVSGTVMGTLGTAVRLTSGGSDRLILDPGASFQGAVDGGGGPSVLEIAASSSGAGLGSGGSRQDPSGAQAATGSVRIKDATNFSVLQVDPLATADGTGAGALSFDTLVNQGAVNVVSGNNLTFGKVASAASIGTINLRPGGTIHFAGAVASQTVNFNPPGGTAVLDDPAHFGGSMTGFAVGSTIDLDKGKASFLSYSGGVLSLAYGGATVGLAVATSTAASKFIFADDGGAGTAITVVPPYAIDNPLMTNSGTGALLFDQVVNGQIVFTQIGAIGPEWELAGSGAGLLNGDGSAGFLMRNLGDIAPGQIDVGEVVNGSATFTPVGGVDTRWEFKGNADFLGDGRSQFLIRNTGNSAPFGQLDLGEVVEGSTIFTALGAFVGSDWEFAGTGDFRGAGKQGFLMRSSLTGQLDVGEISNGTVSLIPIGGVDPVYRFKGVGDFLGDGHTGFLIRNTVSGQIDVGEGANGGFSFTDVGAIGAEWEFVGTGKFLGTRTAFLLRNTSTGALDVGSISGSVGNAAAGLTVVSGVGREWNFHSTNIAVLPHP